MNIVSPGSIKEFKQGSDMKKMPARPNFKAMVRYNSGDWSAEWDARFTHIREAVDAQTRAVNIVVAVDRPYEKIIPGVRPPLTRGMFCEVELQGKTRPGSIIIPRSALHNGNTVFLVDDNNRLHSQEVEVAFAQSNFYCLVNGLQGGETLIVSDRSPSLPENQRGVLTQKQSND